MANSRAKAAALGAACSCGLVGLLSTCGTAPRMPAVDGAVIEIRRSDGALTPSDPAYADTLQLHWFGTACHLIQLGELRILTDPFVTNELKVLRGFRSNPARVAATLGRISPPDVVLVNHSHHDHILDAAAAMQIPSWRAGRVPLYGGQSSKNLLAGYGDPDLDARCHAVSHHGALVLGGGDIRVTAYRTVHGAHLKCGFTLADGLIAKPRRSPPRRLLDYQTGEAFNYLIELRRPGGGYFKILCLGAPADLEKYPESMPPAGTEIDVAIILAPTWDNVEGYPRDHLARLKPRHIVLSHFNTFAKEDPDTQLATGRLDFVKMPKLSREVQSTFVRNAAIYPQFEKLHIPAITQFGDGGEPRNVIRIR